MSVGAKPVARPVQRSRAVTAHAGDPATDRAVDALAQQSDANRPVPRSVRVVDLVVGANRIVTNLGRRAIGANVSPTVADATFAWSFAADGNTTAIITVVGVAQPGAGVEFW